MKKIALSFIVIGIFGIYALWDRSATAVPVVPTTPSITISRRYKDGTYTGPVTDALYGNVQVKVTISGGRITDVIFLDYPQDRSTSREINAKAMPLLKSEAIAAQSAQVDIVSGATQTSRAFIESLKDALNGAI